MFWIMERVEELRKHALIGYFNGKKPALPDFNPWIEKTWFKAVSDKVRVPPLSRGFSFLFESAADKEAVLKGGPWPFQDLDLILMELNEHFSSRNA
jgi:hypothetical protein